MSCCFIGAMSNVIFGNHEMGNAVAINVDLIIDKGMVSIKCVRSTEARDSNTKANYKCMKRWKV